MPNFRDYREFRPVEYLFHYYGQENKENSFLLNFLVDVSLYLWKENNGNKKNILELGGGPSLFSLIPLSLIAQNIDFTDGLERNIRFVEQWLQKKEFFSWDIFLEKTLYLEYKKVYNKEDTYIPTRLVEHRKEVIRRRWNSTKLVDLTKLSLDHRRYDVLSFHFVPECIARSKEEFLFLMQNIFGYAGEDTYFVCSFFLNGNFYKSGNSYFQTYNLKKEEVFSLFQENGIEIILSRTEATVFHNGYKEILCVLAKYTKKPGDIQIRLSDIIYLAPYFFRSDSIKHYGLPAKTFLPLLYGKRIQYNFWEFFYSKIETSAVTLLYHDTFAFLENPEEKFLEYLGDMEIPFQFYTLELLKEKARLVYQMIQQNSKSAENVFYHGFFILPVAGENFLKYKNLFVESGFQNIMYLFEKENIIIPLPLLESIQQLQALLKLIDFLKEKNVLLDKGAEVLSLFRNREAENIPEKPVLFGDYFLVFLSG